MELLPDHRPAPPGGNDSVTRRTVVRLVTEGTYPYVIGGVSSWCDLLVNGLTEIDWELLPITAGGRVAQPVFRLPDHTRLAPAIDLWSLDTPHGRRGPVRDRREVDLPGRLVRSLLCWDNDHADLVDALVWCRQHPGAVRAVFRSEAGWDSFLAGLRVVEEESSQFSARAPHVDTARAGQLYTTMHWIAQTAARATDRADLSHVTAAGWSMIPAAVDKAVSGTPVLLTEHGVFVREAYLAAVRGDGDAVERFVSSRLAWGLARLSYRTADVVSPVADANRHWEVALGVDADRIVTIYNGVDAPDAPTPLPGTRTVTSVGRLDPLKDTATMLRMAAEVRRHDPTVQFVHYGPVPQGQEEYARSCYELHETLGLGEGFRFMGGTSDPRGAMRAADVVVLTSISEGFPIRGTRGHVRRPSGGVDCGGWRARGHPGRWGDRPAR